MYGVSASLFILDGTFCFLSLCIRRLQEKFLSSLYYTESESLMKKMESLIHMESLNKDNNL